jgi:hypothetical protein
MPKEVPPSPELKKRWNQWPVKVRAELFDGFSDAIDAKNGPINPDKQPALETSSSFWEQWKAKQAQINGGGEEDLLKAWLLGRGYRPDLGMGIRPMGQLAIISTADGAPTAAGSASGSGAATTISNLGEIRRQIPKRLDVGAYGGCGTHQS